MGNTKHNVRIIYWRNHQCLFTFADIAERLESLSGKELGNVMDQLRCAAIYIAVFTAYVG